MPQKILQCRPESAPVLLVDAARSRQHQCEVSFDETQNAVTVEIMSGSSAYRIGKYSFRRVPDCEVQTSVAFFPGGFERLECYRLLRIMQSDIAYARGAL